MKKRINTEEREDFSDILARSFTKRKARMRGGKDRRRRDDLIKRLRERKPDEEMIDIAFSPSPMTDNERKKFERDLEKSRVSGEEILRMKLFDDGRVEFVKYEDIPTRSFKKKRKALEKSKKGGNRIKEDFIRYLKERNDSELSEEEEMIEVTFTEPIPADDEREKFEAFMKKAIESGKEIF